MLGGGGGLDTMEGTSSSFHSLPAVEWLAIYNYPARACAARAGLVSQATPPDRRLRMETAKYHRLLGSSRVQVATCGQGTSLHAVTFMFVEVSLLY